MEEVDETQSRPSPTDTSTAKSPGRSGLALVVSCPNQAASGRRSGGGGGRDDCWSEEATEILINAWGERYLELKRGNLKQQHWKEVAEIVNRDNKSPKTDIQCKNRIDTVKKKFKLEKAKIAAGGDDNNSSKWIFFKKLQLLIGERAITTTTTANKALKVTPLSSRSNLYQRQAKSSANVKRSGDSTRWHFRKRVASETESESEPELSADSGESLPPLLLPPPVTLDKTGGRGGREVGEVAMAILGFAESYEKVETLKLKQMVELEKEKMKFSKELELQRIHFFKAQLEMLRNRLEDRDS
ncbi:hypothetical protein ISN45_Aa03g015010 [Arabidopsis thaliana x Arabidopsis arenosa]|uniref:Myb/SANT-like DNA-binding domain-containing protein n=1 Tax=Arabidopsis thaliana x Arabidopsis arenosa TaxID=1240361 RepID=A0A8T2AVV4_9BRAS|nr:hypothetical protein ISN45_Aa03g015010 [Arabidopsis thaliana x Arabidopsis arenosa]